MKIKLNCNHCSSEYEIPHWRKEVSKFCCRKCSDESKKAQPDIDCTYCGIKFHIKKYQLEKYSRTRGYYCGRNCQHKDLKSKMSGKNNHQFGLKGQLNSSFKGVEITKNNNNLIDIRVYVPNHPFCDKNGRVLKHRLLVEENYKLFNIKYFISINDIFYLNKNVDIHHKDENHNNNDIKNLEPLTRSEHTSLHNKQKKIIRDKSGKITGVFKQGELLENLEVDNQQPSLDSNIFEGSTTNIRIQTDNAEDSNDNTSALPEINSNFSDDIV